MQEKTPLKIREGEAWVGLYVHQRSVHEGFLLCADLVFRALLTLCHHYLYAGIITWQRKTFCVESCLKEKG